MTKQLLQRIRDELQAEYDHEKGYGPDWFCGLGHAIDVLNREIEASEEPEKP